MGNTLFGFLLLASLCLAFLVLVYWFIAWVFKEMCLEMSRKPHYALFFVLEFVTLFMFVACCVGVIGSVWMKLAGPDGVPAWVAYLFQKI